MKSHFRFIKSFFILIIRGYNYFNLYVSFNVLFIIAILYFSISITKEMSSEQYKLLFATIGITATFSSLAFRASNSSEDDSKKMIYFLQGKRLFHASISLAISISFIYIRNEIHNIFFIELIRRYPSILKLLKAICILFAQFYFFIALSYIWGAIEKLNATLFDEKLLP